MTASVTRPTGLTPEQVEARKRGIGGSDAAAVLGCDPYRSATDIYELKLGLKQPDPPTPAMKRGIVLEPIARRLYTELTKRGARRLKQQVHPDHSFMLCNVDGMIVGTGNDTPGVLELKCPGIWAFAKAKREGLPLHWIVQMQHNLAVTGYSWGSFALFNADLWELLHFDVQVDLELVHALVVKEEQFWRQHVEKRIPPPAVSNTTPELMAALAKAEEAAGDARILLRNDAEWANAAQTYLEARELLETAENLKATATEKLKQVMAAKGAVEGAGVRVYWSDRDGRVTFDKKALVAAKPLDRTALLDLLGRVSAESSSMSELVNRLHLRIEQAALDLSAFEKRGKAYEDFRVYPLKSVGVGD